MSDDLASVEDYVGGLIAQLEPAARLKLARAVAIDLRRANVERIAAQRNPDGTTFEARKSGGGGPKGLRTREGRIKARVAGRAAGPMFRKLRMARYFKTEATADHAAAGFSPGSTTRIARVHQEGLADRAIRSPKARLIRYPQRVLLGFSETDRRQLLDRVLSHLEI